MRLSVITITCRRDPRFARMAQAIAANLARHPEVELEWIVVDEKLWYDEPTRDKEFFDALESCSAARDDELADRFAARHVMPKPSKWRGPDVDVDRPDHSEVDDRLPQLRVDDRAELLGDLVFGGQRHHVQ